MFAFCRFMPNLNFVPRNLRGGGNSEYGINMKFTNIAKTAAFAAAALSAAANENLEWKPFGTSGSIGAQISENGEMSVSGKFGDASAGFAARANLEPSSAYILKFLAAADTASGGIISGTKFINKSFWQNGKEFSECETVFATTSNPTPSQLTVRLGGWNADGRLAFKNAEILEYFPVSASPALSPSESLKGGFYRCDSQWQFGYDAFQKISTGGGGNFRLPQSFQTFGAPLGVNRRRKIRGSCGIFGQIRIFGKTAAKAFSGEKNFSENSRRRRKGRRHADKHA